MKWRFLTSAVAALLVATVALASILEQRAIPYLNPKIQPRPEVYEGPVPNFEDFTYRNHKCWSVVDGLVCSACYNHPKHYYGQSAVLCPRSHALCRYVLTAVEMDKFGVDPNQCVLK